MFHSDKLLDELFGELFPLDAYIAWLREEYERRRIGDYYVDLACTKPTFDEEGREIGSAPYDPIDGYVDRWLDDRGKNHLSILGDFGTGKTWFCWHYAYRQVDRYLKRPARERIPILISLRDYAKTVGVQQLLSDFFRRHKAGLIGYNVFEALNRRGKFLMLFDGFDEMARRVDYQTVVDNFWILAEVIVPGSKVILTCRTPYFRYTREAHEVLGGARGRPRIDLVDRPRFEVLHLEEFDEDRIRLALNQRLGEAEAEATWARIREVYDLPRLARKPIMIDFILQALPELSPDRPVNPAIIYRIVTDKWLNKNIAEERTILDKWDKLFFMMELAWEMIGNPERLQLKIHYTELPGRIRRHFGERIGKLTKLEHLDFDLRTQSFLASDSVGNYEFALRSLAEYFVALKLVIELGAIQSEYIADVPKDKLPLARTAEQLLHTFGSAPLTPEVAEFLRHLLTKPEHLWALIEWTREKPFDEARYLGGNAATLLKLMGETFQEKALSQTVLAGANLSSADLRRANLNGTDLREANLDNAILDYATCVNANFAQVDLEEWGGVSAIAFHPKGDKVAVAIFDAILKFWEVGGTWRQVSVTRRLPHAPMSIEYNFDGSLLACGHWDGSLVVWNTETGQKLAHIETGTSLYSIAFSPDGRYLVTSDRGGIIRIWDTRQWRELNSISEHGGAVYCVQFSPDSRHLASGNTDKVINIFTVGSWRPFATLRAHSGYVRSLCYSPDGCYLASGGGDRRVILWDTSTGELLQSLEGHTDGIISIDWARNGEQLASGGMDNAIIIWNVERGEQVRSLNIHTDTIFAVRYSPDSRYLISGSDDWTIRVWNSEGDLVHSLSQASWRGVDIRGIKGFEENRLAWLQSRTARGWETGTAEAADPVELVLPRLSERGQGDRFEASEGVKELSETRWVQKEAEAARSGEIEIGPISVHDGDFQNVVLESPHPVLIEFSTPWCGPSRRMKSGLDELAVEYKGCATIVKMNIDENRVVPGRYGISGIPTLVLFVGGREFSRHVGWMPKTALRDRLDAALSMR